ncbi:MAG: DUF4287 domain-containing protein [candidate division SR1 bacterium]|nr:DUF4287 domain-containing protein [candidate division SR1 bacterium]
MSFQAYIDNIKTKTGKTPEDFRLLAEQKGFVMNGKIPKSLKVTQIVNWLKEEFELGHGHVMAIIPTLKHKSGNDKPKS